MEGQADLAGQGQPQMTQKQLNDGTLLGVRP